MMGCQTSCIPIPGVDLNDQGSRWWRTDQQSHTVVTHSDFQRISTTAINCAARSLSLRGSRTNGQTLIFFHVLLQFQDTATAGCVHLISSF